MRPSPRTALGFDFGTRRIGVAVGQELTGTAAALTTLNARLGQPDWEAIGKLIEEWHPDVLVVGLPLNMDGTEHELTALARAFGEQLERRYNLRVYLVDERLSSIAAEQALAETDLPRQKKRQKETVDKMAAQLILQSWLQNHVSQPEHGRDPERR